MSGSDRPDWRDDIRVVRTYRYALGATLSVAIAMGIDWQLSYVAPVLTINLLGSGKPRPSVKLFVGIVGVLGLLGILGMLLSSALLPYPGVFLLVDGLVVYLLYYAAGRGASSTAIALLLIGATVIPVVGLQSIEVSSVVAEGLVWGAVVALGVVLLSHVLIPDPPLSSDAEAQAEAEATAVRPSARYAAEFARLNTLVVYPLVCFFFITGSTAVIVLVFAAFLSVRPDMASGVQAGKALLVGNAMGGLTAVIMYEMLVMMPQFPFFLLLTLLGGLYFGWRTFRGDPKGPLWTMAFQTAILVVASTTSMYGDADAKAFTRVVQIGTAVVYLVVAFRIVPLGRIKALSEPAHAT
ncbi:MAG: DUF2955 domain-containing protein [Gemmatimonadota bacterium]|nr:DUF2955 domain-containing protein [Gemmatimonadota bacterium]